MITNKYHKIITVSYEDSGYLYFENISDQSGWLYPRIHRGMDSSIDPNCEYSLNGVDWASIDFNAWPYHVGPNEDGGAQTGNLPGISVAPGARVYLRGTNTNWNPADWGGAGFRMSVPHIMGGNLLSLIDYQNMDSITTVPKFGEGAYYGPFAGDTNLISAEKMHFGNATTLANTALMAMFQNCTNLVKGPDMSKITTVGNDACRKMFEGCTSLTTAPDLSSVTTVGNNGMQSMFRNCTSLTTSPDLSSVTTVGGNGMWSMLNGCTVLANVPDMSNITTITGENQFRDMFVNCKAIIAGPDMSGITVGQRSFINRMFEGCTSLVTPPDLSNLTNGPMEGARDMFRGCSALTKGLDLKNVTSTIDDSFMMGMYDSCYNLEEMTYPNISTWVAPSYGFGNNIGRDVAGTKTFYAPTGLVIPDGGIPTGWTRVDY